MNSLFQKVTQIPFQKLVSDFSFISWWFETTTGLCVRTCQISEIIFQKQNVFSHSHCSITGLLNKQDGDEGIILLLLGLWVYLAIRGTQSSN